MYLGKSAVTTGVLFGLICSVIGIMVGASHALAAGSDSDLMEFELRPPDRRVSALTGDSAWTIYATGPIDDKAPERLRELINRNKFHRAQAL